MELRYKDKVLGGSSNAATPNPTSDQLINAPIGCIMAWSGTEASVPSGWHVCDGEAGTIDLRGKFVLGASEDHPIGETGGSEEVTLTVAQMPAHTHSIKISGTTTPNENKLDVSTSYGSYLQTSNSVRSAGSSQPHPNMPPYYALLFIQKVSASPADYVTEERVDEKIEEALGNQNGSGDTVAMDCVSKDDLYSQMYQPPTHTTLVTAGNLPEGATVTQTLQQILGDNLDSSQTNYPLVINSITIGTYTSSSTLEDILADINANEETGVSVVYDPETSEFTFTAKKLGSSGSIDLGEGLAEAIFWPASSESTTTFCQTYGITWLKAGETEKVKFTFSAYTTNVNVSNTSTIDAVAAELNEVIYNDGWTAGYNKYTGKLEVTDQAGTQVEFTMADSYGDPVKFKGVNDLPVTYTHGLDGVFVGIQINGKVEPLNADKTVHITIPKYTSQLTNNSGFQTADQVTSAINAAMPTIPTNVSEFENDAGYQTEAQVASAIEGAVPTVGDGLVKKNGTLSVSIPVRLVTTAEYDVLSQEQKANGLTFIKNDDGSINNIILNGLELGFWATKKDLDDVEEALADI